MASALIIVLAVNSIAFTEATTSTVALNFKNHYIQEVFNENNELLICYLAFL